MDKQKIIADARTLKETDFPQLGSLYRGKVRDNYSAGKNIIMIATDRISCFDHVLNRQIAYKGHVLTEIMCRQGEGVSDIIPFHVVARPDPQVVVVRSCNLYDVEMVVRGYITGSLWRDYTNPKKGPQKAGEQYGLVLPEGLKESQKFDKPIITPTTKAKPKPGSAKKHHDVPVTREEIVSPTLLREIEGIEGIKGDLNPFYIEESKYAEMEERTLAVFKRGQEMASNVGLILVDTKYEFGDNDGVLTLVDEVHTPDSSRFWHADTYQAKFEVSGKQKSLSKEFVREWLLAQGYDKEKGESSLATLTDEVATETALRYIELCETITGKPFTPGDMSRPLEERILAALGDAGYLK